MRELLGWYRENGRSHLPWRETRDPYRILVSELMLQQTQVPRVVPKYEAFVRRFPTLADLAAAPRQDVLALWQGLGYNSRAVRLHALARLVTHAHRGELPRTEEELRALPGIGSYTAGAVMIFAHDTPAHSVDVNVARVLRRLFFERDERPTAKDIDRLARSLVDAAPSPHDWHSALMDFGSAVCTSRNPACATCPLLARCKSKGARPDERARAQPRFAGSNRWWRGQVLKRLLERAYDEEAILRAIAPDAGDTERAALRKALSGMLEEGLIARDGDALRLQG